jgi:acetyl esterase/lipase
MTHDIARSLVFARVQGLELSLDVYEHDPTTQAPAIVYFHAGGLSYGDRRSWRPDWLIGAQRRHA